MNIHDVVRATRVAEKVLAERTTLTPMQRAALVLEIQVALIDSEVNESTPTVVTHGSVDSDRPAPALPMESGRRFSLIPLTPRGASMVDAIDRVLERLPHGERSV